MVIDLPGYEARLFVLEQIEKLVDSDRLFGTRSRANTLVVQQEEIF
jgi:hypothetical protein